MKMTGEVRIAASPAAVWARLMDLGAAPEYVPYLAAAAPMTAGPLAVGSTARLTFRGGNLQAAGTATVTDLQPPQRLAFRIEVPEYHLLMDVTLSVVAEGAGSRVSEQAELRFTSLFMKTMGEGLLRQRDPEAHLRQGLERLRRSVEVDP